ncbi:alpha/beta fold hydrolase [Pseudofrankia inefficax]|uniref:Alpha/beta hydrolase fold protein n=1 Tax=Pseudofrankia inefficax (strain DSM 45817 / CECT 9037 / DDB 130130 / EuI1c) TaxID=298654 RepID=E3J9W1_PSEI1|nr:alpha/beta hydrolase [Pseudofrankia inefficax]ADP78523.1 alpha/beta hydrolase fold protein [Pseudofrankia inefficax]
MASGAERIQVRAGVLDVTLERSGSRDGRPVVLLHGFPYDARCYDEVARLLAAEGADVVVPYLRGYGETRFTQASTPRSGQQAALAHDLLALIDVLGLESPLVAGYDWGGRAACVVSALWPRRVGGLVTATGYNIQDIAASSTPRRPELERRLWYQYYLHGERGVRGLAAYRSEFARQLWREWSPTWGFSETAFAASARSFDNPDFVDVVVHSYRHRYGLVAGDPAYEPTEAALALQPPITVPTVVLDGEHDTVQPPKPRAAYEPHFPALVAHRVLNAGHNAPQEAPADFARAITDLWAAL